MNLTDFSANRWPAHTRLIQRGTVLFWQGDPDFMRVFAHAMRLGS